VFELQRERYIAAQASRLHLKRCYGLHISGKRIPRENHTERVQLYKHSAFAGSMILLNETACSPGSPSRVLQFWTTVAGRFRHSAGGELRY
jgi:hypothetical protein